MVAKSSAVASLAKSQVRVEAGRRNARKRRAWGIEDRTRLREQCFERQPWLKSTGPRTERGKLRAAQNGNAHKPDPKSKRQVRASVADVYALVIEMSKLRRSLL